MTTWILLEPPLHSCLPNEWQNYSNYRSGEVPLWPLEALSVDPRRRERHTMIINLCAEMKIDCLKFNLIVGPAISIGQGDGAARPGTRGAGPSERPIWSLRDAETINHFGKRF